MDEDPELEPKEVAKIDGSQASKIYLLPNLFTAGNLFFGFLAIKNCIQARYNVMLGDDSSDPNALYRQAVLFILGGMLCDSLDGRVARLGGRESLFGKEFDSIADIVTFGIAPSLMVLFLLLNPAHNEDYSTKVGFFLAFVYLLCAGVRLARFNVITHPAVYSEKLDKSSGDFLGLPVPAAAGMIATLVLVMTKHGLEQRWAIALPVLMLFISYLMISSIRYPSFKNIGWQTQIRFRTFVAVLALFAIIYFSREYALVLMFLGYLFYGVVRHLLRLRKKGEGADPAEE
ncbi:CDP-diacylglycerol--serine O-phosphatidyltransferase [Pelagicoccus sp. SDUM812003]|uniref:CDP-diacylglycerol--serine O-phosphatidyltransferase n=1 Tax=Pelagicoccus sp. SDUM812003 TaxID=3041267 RepID=UPI00280F5D85|nr:CDP-diacylglycerol--serine O-phosphatidyltransferase [Pelagicoccus sp. SDUM812003]MDQ8204217.1 CDP-diacylglycerol--serine O-phosphatidyltransferase [Pelagicoccus sp. SDUM812003]